MHYRNEIKKAIRQARYYQDVKDRGGYLLCIRYINSIWRKRHARTTVP